MIEATRLFIIAAPVALSLAQVARADNITETVEIEELANDRADAPGLAHFGPFRVASDTIAELIDVTDEASPQAFRAMIAAWPKLRTIRLVDCPGTENDEANLELARMIRTARLDTVIPRGGSARSGGVELFLAGIRRTAEPGAALGVHSWQDDEGNEARDVADDPARNLYTGYYREIGLAPETAQAFYAFTNQTPFDRIHYLTAPEIARFGLTN